MKQADTDSQLKQILSRTRAYFSSSNETLSTKRSCMYKYAIYVPANYGLCVFLNDGHDIDQGEYEFLLVEVNGPREITTKLVTREELKSAQYKDYLPIADSF